MIAPTSLFRLISVCVLLAILPVRPIDAGTIAVQVRDARGTLEDAVVYAVPEGPVTPVSPRRIAVMDQKDRMFIPHVLIVQTGTSVQFPNSDDIRHHVYSFSPAKAFQLPLYKGTPANPVVFDKAGVVMLGCNIHDRMSAFIVIVDTPYFEKADKAGRVLMALPAGKYQLHLWYAAMREEPKPISTTIAGDERHEVQFVVGRSGGDQRD